MLLRTVIYDIYISKNNFKFYLTYELHKEIKTNVDDFKFKNIFIFISQITRIYSLTYLINILHHYIINLYIKFSNRN